jgi:hypothetical protein
MNLPPGAKLRRVADAGEDGMLVSWQDLSFAISAIPEAVESFAYAGVQPSPGVELVVSSVCFGEVSGTKCVRLGESWRGPFKQVNYVLAVPGGNVEVLIGSGSKVRDMVNWDESKVEHYLNSLKVAVKQPPIRDL